MQKKLKLKSAVLALALVFLSASAFGSSNEDYVWQNGPPSDANFFPIAVWVQSPSNAGRYQDIGINTYIGLWQGPTESQLEGLEAYGMPAIASQNEVGLTSSRNYLIQGWMQQDEPDNAQPKAGGGYDPCVGPQIIQDLYNEMKANDPTRPVYINFGRGVAHENWYGRGTCTGRLDMYPEYINGADIISFDIYPVTSCSGSAAEVRGKLEYVAIGVERLVEWAQGEKIVWNILETTHIGCEDRPTPEQIRTEIWMSLIHGSMGITYFVHEWYPSFSEPGIFRYPEIVEAVTEINAQITELAPVLNSPTIEEGVQVSSTIPIKTMVKNYDGNLYLFAVAMQDENTTAGFTAASLPATGTAEVLGESRQIEITSGQFQDDFAGYGVHLYKISPEADSCTNGIKDSDERGVDCGGSCGNSCTFYLDAEEGNDADPGTSDMPWKTLAKAQSTVTGGDTVILQSGNYGTYEESNVSRSDWVTYKAAPSADVTFTRIRIRNGSYGNTGDSYLKFDGIDIVKDTGNCVYLQYCNYIEITNSLIEPDYITINGASEDWYIWTNQIGIRATQASHVSLDNVTISRSNIAINITNEGGGEDRGHSWSITNSHFGPLAAIAIYNQGAHDVNVFDNTIRECNSLHSEYHLVTGGVTGTLIPGEELVQSGSGAKGQYTRMWVTDPVNNVGLYRTTTTDFVDGQQVTGQESGAYFTVTNYWKGKSHGTGIYIHKGDNMQVRRNYINLIKEGYGLDIGYGTYAIEVTGISNTVPITNLVIADNLLVSGKTGDGVLKIYGTASADVINNTVIGGDFLSYKNYSSIKVVPGTGYGTNTVIDNFYNNIGKLEYRGESGGYHAEIKNHGNNILSNNPDGMGSGPYVFTVNGTELVNQNIWTGYFTNYDNLDFTLVADSNAIDFGNPAHATETDIEGNPRDSQPDAGAYEFQGQECVNTPALLNYISQWKQGQIRMLNLMQKIAKWKSGEGC